MGINTSTFSMTRTALLAGLVLGISTTVNATALDRKLDKIIAQHGLTGDPSTGRDLPDANDPQAQLGKKLFFTKLLSGDKDTACVSCHHPMLGGGDALPLPIGVHAVSPDLLGPGRKHAEHGFGHDGGPTVPRNAPTTYNLGLWDKTIFHDGRIEALSDVTGTNGTGPLGIRTPSTPFGFADLSAHNLSQAQARFPVTSPEEMRAEFLEGEDINTLHSALAYRLGQFPQWEQAFAEVYTADEDGEVINATNIFTAIGEYERSQVLVENAWKRYVQGDRSALTRQQKKGAKLFFTDVKKGGGGCVACHSGDFFTDEKLHVTAFPQLGRGKGDGRFGDEDFGRFRETQVTVDKFAFRTPSLLNVEYTAPYGHAGSFSTLVEVIQYHADPIKEFSYYPFSQRLVNNYLQEGLQAKHAKRNTRIAAQHLGKLIKRGQSQLQPGFMNAQKARQLASFLRALSDKRIEDRNFMSRWIASEDEADFDNMRLIAHDQDGNPL